MTDARSVTRRSVMLGVAGTLTAATLTAATAGIWFGRSRAAAQAPATPSPSASPTPSGSATPAVDPPQGREVKLPHVSIQVAGWYSWALLERSTGTIFGSANAGELNNTASMIKAWIAADYLSRNGNPGPDALAALSTMIRDSANDPASDFFDELGREDSIDRMNRVCGLEGAKAGAGFGFTRMSARDAVRVAHAIGSGKAAGPHWTDWLVNEMRNVRGDGDFGIRMAFPAAQRGTIAIKNGWDTWTDTGEWTVNCMALAQPWTMAVLTRYPENLGFDHGAQTAETVAAQLMASSDLV